jgi:hypothetical protein
MYATRVAGLLNDMPCVFFSIMGGGMVAENKSDLGQMIT